MDSKRLGEMPLKKRGGRIPPQGEGGFDQNWYPVCKSEDVRPGELVGRPFLNGKVLVYRGMDGQMRVMSPFCRHFGADLTIGGVVLGNDLRCPYHYWKYGPDGMCAEIPSGDEIPKNARLFVFPVLERWGLVFAFNGAKPLYELPDFPVSEHDLVLRTYGILKFKLDIGLQITNSVDFQHLVVLHKINIVKYPKVQFGRYWMTQKGMCWEDPLRGANASDVDLIIGGTNTLMFWGDMGGQKLYFLLSGTPIATEGCTHSWTVVGAPKGDGSVDSDRALQTLLGGAEKWAHALIVEDDQPIMDNISFRADNLSASDKYVGRFLAYLKRYPRANPAEDFIVR